MDPALTLSPVEQVRRINRTWIVHGDLERDTENYLASLEKRNPGALVEACARAVEAARAASREQRDPKPDFYAALFRDATAEERIAYLRDHPWTLALSAQLKARQSAAHRAPD